MLNSALIMGLAHDFAQTHRDLRQGINMLIGLVGPRVDRPEVRAAVDDVLRTVSFQKGYLDHVRSAQRRSRPEMRPFALGEVVYDAVQALSSEAEREDVAVRQRASPPSSPQSCMASQDRTTGGTVAVWLTVSLLFLDSPRLQNAAASPTSLTSFPSISIFSSNRLR